MLRIEWRTEKWLNIIPTNPLWNCPLHGENFTLDQSGTMGFIGVALAVPAAIYLLFPPKARKAANG